MECLELKNLDIIINKGDLICIVGNNGSGKTNILRMISGRVKNDYVYIDKKSVSQYSLKYKQSNIVTVFDDNLFNSVIVNNELSYYLKKLLINDTEISSRINYFTNYFDLGCLINSTFDNMTLENRIYIKLLSFLIIKPEIFCVDDLFTYLSNDKVRKIFNYIKENQIILIAVISDIEQCLDFDKILLINKGKKVLFDNIDKAFQNDRIFNESGIGLPFIYDLNNLLKNYELIDKNYYVYRELVNNLWK